MILTHMAIRALPDFRFGITSELRLGVKLIFPPDHSDHLLGPRFQRPGLSLTLCLSAGPRTRGRTPRLCKAHRGPAAGVVAFTRARRSCPPAGPAAALAHP